MFNVQIILRLICLSFMLKASIVKANDRISNRNKPDVSFYKNECGENLTNPDSNDFKSLPYAYRDQFKDVLIERIRSMQGESQKDLERQGYTSKYTAGFDDVKTNLQVAHLLRQRFSDPKNHLDIENTHIPKFAHLIASHINFIERSIRSQNSADRDVRLNQLMQLRYEAQVAQETKQVTYRWWLDFNLHLSILVTPQENRIAQNEYFLGTYIDITPDMAYTDISFIVRRALNNFLDRYEIQFPELIMLPTIENSGHLGIMSINRTYGTGVHLIGLTDRPMNVHHKEEPPFLFFNHDILHAAVIQIDTNPFTSFFIHKLKDLPKSQKERVELVLFELTHEHPLQLSTIAVTEPIQRVVNRTLSIEGAATDHTEFFPFMPPGHNHTYNDVNSFLQQARSDFIRFFTEVRAEFVPFEMTNIP